MTWQQVAALLIVLAAVAYLVWKMTRGSRPPAGRPKKGPDVPVSRLARRKKRDEGSSSCH